MAIPLDVERKLWARSGGHCARPGCNADLFPDVHPERVATILDLAHIIARSKAGPRGVSPLSETERDAFENIILLCPNCHRLVDQMKLANLYHEEALREWKRQHEQRVADAVNVPRLESRDELVRRVQHLMRENRSWWETYGPESAAAADDPVSEAPRQWVEAVQRVLIPNNWQIVRLIEQNSEYLTPVELNVVARFKVHADVFAKKHLTGDADPYAPRYPQEMDEIFGLE